MWGHDYVITSRVEIAVLRKLKGVAPIPWGYSHRSSFSATRRVCLEGALVRTNQHVGQVEEQRISESYERFLLILSYLYCE